MDHDLEYLVLVVLLLASLSRRKMFDFEQIYFTVGLPGGPLALGPDFGGPLGAELVLPGGPEGDLGAFLAGGEEPM